MSRVVVVGGGLGGLASAALLGRAGHEVTLLEANPWLGGKSRRIELDGRRMDTGPIAPHLPRRVGGVHATLGRCGWEPRRSVRGRAD